MFLSLFKSYPGIGAFQLYGNKLIMYAHDGIKCYALPDLKLVYQPDSIVNLFPFDFYVIEVTAWKTEILNYHKEVIETIHYDNKTVLSTNARASGNLLLIPQMDTNPQSKAHSYNWLKINIYKDKVFMENINQIEARNPDYISGSVAIALIHEYDRSGEINILIDTYIYGWDLQKNQKIWESKITDKEYRLERVISLGDDRAAVFFNTHFLCIIHLDNGRILWCREQVELIATESDVVYVLDKSSKAYQVLNALDGVVIRSVFLGENQNLDFWFQNSFIVGDLIIMLAFNARVYVLKKEDCAVLQEIKIKDHNKSSGYSKIMREISVQCDHSYLYVHKKLERQLDIYAINTPANA